MGFGEVMAKNALVVEKDGTHSVIDVETEFLSKMQSAVDGLIQPVDVSRNLTMWVNEEFLFRNSFEPNLLGTAIYQSLGVDSVILGTVVFTGGTDSQGEVEGLADYELETLLSMSRVVSSWAKMEAQA